MGQVGIFSPNFAFFWRPKDRQRPINLPFFSEIDVFRDFLCVSGGKIGSFFRVFDIFISTAGFKGVF